MRPRLTRSAPPRDVHPEAVKAMLASVPDLIDALADYEPPELAQLLDDFVVEVTCDKQQGTLELPPRPHSTRPEKGRDRLVGGRGLVT